MSEETLRLIAAELKSLDTRPYERTFMLYYLPEMTVGAGAWATTHFTPLIEIRIQGITLEQEERLLSGIGAESRDTVGAWMDESAFSGGKLTSVVVEGKTFLETAYAFGGVSVKELVEKKSALGRRFDMVEQNWSKDHYVLLQSGDLQIRDKDGLIVTARAIK